MTRVPLPACFLEMDRIPDRHRSRALLAGTVALLVLLGPPGAGARPPDPLPPGGPGFDPDGKGSVYERSTGAADNCVPPEGHYPPFDPNPSYDVTHYDIQVAIEPSSRLLSGNVRIDAVALHEGMAGIVLDYCGPAIQSVTVGGTPATYFWTAGSLTVLLGSVLSVGTPFSVTVAYSGTVAVNRGVYWPSVSDPPEVATTYTFAEPEDARTWFPCHDDPADKATVDLSVLVPEDLVVGSNGVLVPPAETPGDRAPSMGPADLGSRVFHWRETHPISTYLVSFAAARYTILRDDRLPGIPITNYVYEADSLLGVTGFDKVPEMIQYFSEKFGPYAFDKYGHAIAPFPGGMEHQSLTTITRQAIALPEDNQWLIAHELAHQWWGDSVTLRDWRHIWLNEGFASYGDALWGEHVNGRDGLNARMNVFSDVFKLGFVSRNIVSTVVDPPANYLFGFTVYDKGAWVLHMLRHVMGDSAFFGALRDYRAAHLYGNAVTEDFIAACETRHGGDLDWYFQPWLYDVGLPRYGYSWGAYPAGLGQSEVTVVLRQKQASPFFPMPVDFAILSGADTVRTTVFIDQNPDTFRVIVPEPPPAGGVIVDPDNWILKTVDFDGPFVPVALLTFSLERSEDEDRVLVRWSVGEEARRNLYRVHRALPGGVREPIQEEPFTGRETYVFADGAPPAGEADYWLEEISPSGATSWYGPLHLSGAASADGRIRLAPGRPNPFRTSTVFAYTLPAAMPVRLSVHDVSGRLVSVLVDRAEAGGSYQVTWDGRDGGGGEAPPGVYFVKLDLGPAGSRTGRIVKVR